MATLFFWLKLLCSNLGSVVLISALIFGNWSDPNEYVVVGFGFFLYAVAFGFFQLERRAIRKSRRMFESSGALREPTRAWRRSWQAYLAVGVVCPGAVSLAAMLGSRYSQITLAFLAAALTVGLTYRVFSLALQPKLLAERIDSDRAEGGYGEWYLLGYPYLLFWSVTLLFQSIHMVWGESAFANVAVKTYAKDWGWYTAGLAVNDLLKDAPEFLGFNLSPIKHVGEHWVSVLVLAYKGIAAGTLWLLVQTSYRLVVEPPRVIHLPKE